jgi:hypothetical protein
MCTKHKFDRRTMNTNTAVRKRSPKISKGYRLKLSTHKMIRKIQEELNSTQDKVISSAVRSYYLQIRKNN